MELKMFLVAAGCFLFLGSVNTVVDKKAKITASPTGGVYLVGTTVKLTCSFIDGTALAALGATNWFKEGRATPVASVAGRVTLSQSGTKVAEHLTITVIIGDTGKYQCTPQSTAAVIAVPSDKFSLVVEAPKTPKLTCPTTTLKAGEETTCTCASTNELFKPTSYEFTVGGEPKPSAGSESPKDKVTFDATEELDGKDVTCKAKFSNDAAGLSAAATAKLSVEPAPTTTPAAAVCSGEEARVSLMTIGFVLLLSTLLMKG